MSDAHKEQAREIVETWYEAPNGYRGHVLVEEERTSLAELIASALASRDTEVREVLGGLTTRRWYGDKPTVCWCDPRAYPDSDEDEDHGAGCRRARELYTKLTSPLASEATVQDKELPPQSVAQTGEGR